MERLVRAAFSNAVMENRWPERRNRKLLQSVLGFPLAGRTDRDIVIFIRRAVFPNFRQRTRRITRGRVRLTRFSIRYGLERSIQADSIRFSRFSQFSLR